MSRTDVTAAFILTSSIAILASAQVSSTRLSVRIRADEGRKPLDPARYYRLERYILPDTDLLGH